MRSQRHGEKDRHHRRQKLMQLSRPISYFSPPGRRHHALTYGSRNTASFSNTASTPSIKYPLVPVGPMRHFPILSASHLTMYTNIPATVASDRRLANAARRRRSESSDGVDWGTSAMVSLEKYNWSSWGSTDLAEGRRAEVPVTGS